MADSRVPYATLSNMSGDRLRNADEIQPYVDVARHEDDDLHSRYSEVSAITTGQLHYDHDVPISPPPPPPPFREQASSPDRKPNQSPAYVQTRALGDISDDRASLALSRTPSDTRRGLTLRRDWGWWWEAWNILVSLIFLALIVAILFRMDNKPLSNWTLSIKPNSIISVFATISKVALVMPITECISQLKWLHFEKTRPMSHLQAFDDASRGPWGCVLFIWKTRATALIASAGAVLMIVALAFEPTAQQILSYTQRMAPVHNATTMAYAPDWGSKGFEGSPSEMLSVQSLIMQAFTDRAGEVSPVYSCPTSTCDWPDFTSLAVCGSCQTYNASAADMITCNYVYTPKDSENSTIIPDFTSLQELVKKEKITNLPSQDEETGASLSLGNCSYTPSDESYSQIAFYPQVYNFTMTGSVPNGVIMDAIARNVAVAMGNTTTADGDVDGDVDSPNWFARVNVTISLCELNFCARHYTGMSVKNGAIRTANVTELPLSMFNISSVQDTGAATFRINSSSIPAGSNISSSTVYGINFLDRTQLWEYLAALFGVSNAYNKRSSDFSQSSLDETLGHYLSSANLTAVTKSFADILTNIARSGDNTNMTQVYGQAYDSVAFVQVHWGWLAVPLVIILLAIVLLVMCIVVSTHRPLLLKSSAIALLFHGLEGWDHREFEIGGGSSVRETPERLTGVADGMMAKLERNENGGLHFVRMKSE